MNDRNQIVTVDSDRNFSNCLFSMEKKKEKDYKYVKTKRPTKVQNTLTEKTPIVQHFRRYIFKTFQFPTY